MKEKGLLKDFWENFEEYLCSCLLYTSDAADEL